MESWLSSYFFQKKKSKEFRILKINDGGKNRWKIFGKCFQESRFLWGSTPGWVEGTPRVSKGSLMGGCVPIFLWLMQAGWLPCLCTIIHCSPFPPASVWSLSDPAYRTSLNFYFSYLSPWGSLLNHPSRNKRARSLLFNDILQRALPLSTHHQ